MAKRQLDDWLWDYARFARRRRQRRERSRALAVYRERTRESMRRTRAGLTNLSDEKQLVQMRWMNGYDGPRPLRSMWHLIAEYANIYDLPSGV
jgi:hypothetical protein